MVYQKFPNELFRIKDSILRGLIITLLAFAIPAIGIAILSGRVSGHFPFISISASLIALIFLIFYKSIPYKLKAWTVLFLGYLLGTRGLLDEGLLSHAFLYFLMLTTIASMLINVRASMILIGLNLLTATFTVLAINQKWFKYNFSIETYFYLPSTWIGFILILLIFSILSMMIYRSLETNLEEFTAQILSKSESLRQSNLQLEEEMQEKQKMQFHLTQNEKKFRNVFNSIKDGILLCNADNVILDVNNAFINMMGSSSNDILKMNLKEIFSDGDRLDVASFNLLSTSRINNNELDLKTTSELIPVELSVAPFQSEEDHLYILVVKDIRDRKNIEYRILNAMIESEEKERKRIAQELHDGLGPLLSAAKLYAGSAEIGAQTEKGAKAKNELLSLLSQAVNTVREISGNLSSHVLISLGLKRALLEFVKAINHSETLNIDMQIPENLSFKESVTLTIYRVFEELLNNTIKYANARKVVIKMDDKKDTTVFTYTDDGEGFDFIEVKKNVRGMGIYNIHSRIQSIGGVVNFNSSKGNGVKVSFTIPSAEINIKNKV